MVRSLVPLGSRSCDQWIPPVLKALYFGVHRTVDRYCTRSPVSNAHAPTKHSATCHVVIADAMLMFQPWFFHQQSGQLGRQVLSWGDVSDLRRLGREPVSSLSVSLHIVLVLLSLPSGFAFVG